IAMRYMKGREKDCATRSADTPLDKGKHGVSDSECRTSFKGFELSRRSYEVSSFECRGCSNVCEINRVKIEDEDGFLFYGGRCEKYDVKKKKDSQTIPDLFAFREEMLWKAHEEHKTACAKRADVTEKNHSRLTPHASTRIGIPYIFFFHDYLPFWSTLLWELGFDVEVSPKTNKEIVNIGAESVLAETCFPVKVAHGHIQYLLRQGIKTILIPSFVNMNNAADEFENGFACPLTQTIPYAAKVAHPDAEILVPIVNLRSGKRVLETEIARVLRPFGIKKNAVINAMKTAEKAQTQFSEAIKAKGKDALSPAGAAVVVVGRPYNAFDRGANLNIPKKLADLGVLAVPMDFISAPLKRIDDKWPNMYWRSGQRILRAARFIRENPGLSALFISNFSCGPDSFIIKFFKEEMRGKPFLQIEIDEHSADAGAITRCEAFLDSLASQNEDKTGMALAPETKVPHHVNVGRHPSRTVFVPRMSDHSLAIAAAFERCGIPSEVLPASDKEAIDLGRRYVSGKECYPCTVTTGDMLKKVFSRDFTPDRAAFFMPSGSGPCRFGQYNVFHRMILDELGYCDIPIFSPNQDANFYQELGIVGKDFSAHAWKGIIAYELLTKCLHETRPHEKERGASDALYEKYRRKMNASLRGTDGAVERVLDNARKDFEHLPKCSGKKPIIGIVGEIFVRSHKFSNEDLIRKVEALGGEAWLAPMEEWISYVNLMAVRKALIKRDSSAIIKILLKNFFQKKIEHRLSKSFSGFLKTLDEPDTSEILKQASPYLHDSFEGEAILSIGKSIDLIQRGASGIINAMPFGCMPGTVVTTLMHGVSRDYGVPCISMPYDGTESATIEIQLEAFMNQACEYRRTVGCKR
ncbi:MAG TPA: acyl-CoA dehydratase activase-related protein, partial [Thermodesulfovibrionales bacterium]|nr:acyl-CoA dehydratase activase-related protein [Thermodesulfovibrionales bacterium]